jgi:hypothetical protein
MNGRGMLLAVLVTIGTYGACMAQSTYKGVQLMSRSTNPQRLASAPGAQSRSTNPQGVLKLDPTKKVLTATQPHTPTVKVKYSQITAAEYDAANQNMLTVHYTGAPGNAQQLQVALPPAQADEIVKTLETHTGKTVVRKSSN